MFRNTLAANDKYLTQDCENFSSPIQMELPLKPKTFSNFSFHFWNLHQILNILKKKMMVIGTLLRKLQTLKELVIKLSKKHRLRTPFVSQHAKGSQTLVKSASEH